ncbi:MAG: AAA family ATPase [Bacteroidales bacterium]|nr:AAA family ATPase [Bacteroidales bacterium]
MPDITSLFPFPPKPGQARAAKMLDHFIQDPGGKAFLLKGYAGTGKTTMIYALIRWLERQNIRFRLLASTGRAAKVLSDITERMASTIHSHIYKFTDLNQDLEEMADNSEKAYSNKYPAQLCLLFEMTPIISTATTIYIVDEASMVSDLIDRAPTFAKYGSNNLLKDLFDFDKNSKFIFVGDPCQLPPVGQKFSPALSKQYLFEEYNIEAEEFELTEIIRQESQSGILETATRLRSYYFQPPANSWPPLFPFRNKDNISLHPSHASLITAYISNLKNNGYVNSTMVCQSNALCHEINKMVKANVTSHAIELRAGDLLMVTQNNYIVDLVNGDLVEILDVGASEYRAGMQFIEVEVRELASKEIYRTLLINDILISTAQNINEAQHRSLFIDYYKRMKELGIKQKSQAFKDGMLKDPYLNALRAVYGYALTCHKTQGGEWDEVYLYTDNKTTGIPQPGVYQWLYTAVTRAKKSLHCVDDWYMKQ